MTLLGLMTYSPEMFNNLLLPPEMDRTIAVDTILLECGELEILYPDPDFMGQLILAWSRKEQDIWQKLLDTTKYEYNPIDNFDRKEETTESENINEDYTMTNHNIANISDNSSPTQTQHTQIFPFNDNLSVSKDIIETSGTNISTSNNIEDGNNTNKGDRSRTYTRTNHMHGNIGVTTTQQMIEQERNISWFCVYDEIAKSFKSRFCIPYWGI